jgi:hypothetical protein
MDVDSLGRGLREGEGDRDGNRDDPGDAGVLWPDENDDSESVRKNGDDVVGSGTPSSSAYKA